MKKIAAVTDDGKIISAHFGRATQYAVFTIENGQIVDSELREKAGHHDFQNQGEHGHSHGHAEHGHGYGRHAGEKHRMMFASIPDCEVVLARGMGQGAYQGAMQHGINPILTDISDIETAVQLVIEGRIENHPERLH